MSYNPIENHEEIRAQLEKFKKVAGPENKSVLEQIIMSVDKLAHDASSNPVTGYHSTPRRDYDARKIMERRKLRKYDQDFDFFVTMVDLDKFGNFNKEYGEHVGNKVLKTTTDVMEEDRAEVEKMLKECLRDEDIVCKAYHLHGEEMQLIFQAPSKEIAALIINRLRKNLEQKSKVKSGYNITATFGITKWNVREGEKLERAQERADRIMQEGKKEYRNRVYYRD